LKPPRFIEAVTEALENSNNDNPAISVEINDQVPLSLSASRVFRGRFAVRMAKKEGSDNALTNEL